MNIFTIEFKLSPKTRFMTEYMLLVRNLSEQKNKLSDLKQEEFLQQCRNYIDRLRAAGKLIAAQPLQRNGIIVLGTKGNWSEKTLPNESIQVGYYHILASNLEEAVAIAKENPEFEYFETASVEVRPVKMKEETTGFVYPVAG
jgi:hypothetical protein